MIRRHWRLIVLAAAIPVGAVIGTWLAALEIWWVYQGRKAVDARKARR
jgi:hypothetical protein